MCNNRTLAVAVLAALSMGTKVQATLLNDSATISTMNSSEGCYYATEMFGSTASSFTLPDGKTAKAIYTVDGTLDIAFQMIFTLDNGAKFVSTPMLAVTENSGNSFGSKWEAANTAANAVNQAAIHYYNMFNAFNTAAVTFNTGAQLSGANGGGAANIIFNSNLVGQIDVRTGTTTGGIFGTFVVGGTGGLSTTSWPATGLLYPIANAVGGTDLNGIGNNAYHVASNAMNAANSLKSSGALDAASNTNYNSLLAVFNGLVTAYSNVKAKAQAYIAANDAALAVLPGKLSTTGTALSSGTLSSDKTSITFALDASGAINDSLTTGDKITLTYNITNAQALKEAGQKVNMSLEGKTTQLVQVFRPETVAVATATQGVKATIAPVQTAQGMAKIAVAKGETEFSGSVSTSPVGTYQNKQLVKLGTLYLANETKAVAKDCTTVWKIGDTGAQAGSSKKTTFSITNGQFAASATTPGQVYLETGGVATVDNTGVTATWTLSDDSLKNMAAASTIGIFMQLDGKTAVNTPEDAPLATLTIDYDTDGYQTITYPSVELPKIKRDGTVCTVYNVPATGAADTLSIRVTNTSNTEGVITGALYGTDGTELIAKGTDLLQNMTANTIKKGQTIRLSSEDLVTLAGGTAWTGRAILRMTSNLTNMEVLALLRQNLADGTTDPNAPLTNMSQDASGSTCDN